jgi:hypothetical protein
MWFWRRPPLPREARQREIAQLGSERDYLLENAGRSVLFRRGFMPPVFAVFVVLMCIDNLTLAGRQRSLHLLVYATLMLTVGRFVERNWFHPSLLKGDLWVYSDTITYDGDSPRDVWKKIETLRARSNPAPVTGMFRRCRHCRAATTFQSARDHADDRRDH